MNYMGDYAVGQIVYIWFNTFDSNDPSASVTMTDFVTGDAHVHKDDSLTQRGSTTGQTIDIDIDGVAGVHWIKIDTADNTTANFYEAGHDYFVRIEGVTIDGGTVNAVVGCFSIANRRTAGQMAVTSIEGLTDQNTFTLTTGEASGDDDAYNDCLIIVTDQVTKIQKAIGYISDYTGSTRSVQLYASPLCTGFTMAIGDSVEIFSSSAFTNVHTVNRTAQTAGDVPALVTTVDTVVDGIQTDLSNGADGLGAIKAETALIVADTGELQSDDTPTAIAAVQTVVDKIPLSDGTVSWNATALAAIESEANDALVAQKLDHLVAVAESDDPVDNSIIAKLANSGATADWSLYVNTTDSLMAIRDHIGDGTNLSEAGGDGDHLTAINLPNQTMDIVGSITGNLSGSVGSVTGAVGSVTGAVGSVAGNVDGNVTGSVGSNLELGPSEVNTQVDTALTDIHLDHLMAVAAADVIVDGSVIAHMVSTTEDWSTFIPSTDSLQSIRDKQTDIEADTNELQADDIPTLIAAVQTVVDKIPLSDGTNSWNATALAAINAEVDTALDTAISELGVAKPSATPTLRTGLMLLYMALRNKTDVNTTASPDVLEIHNDAGTIIATKDISDDGTDYSEAEMATG